MAAQQKTERRVTSDVLVVGGGPVGLSIATFLEYYGVKTTVIEKNTSTSVLAKATSLSGRTMELFRKVGIERAIQEASYPRDLPLTINASTGVLNGNILFSEALSSWGDIVDGVPGSRFVFFQNGASVCPPLICPQVTLEPLLKTHLERKENVEVFWGCRAKNIHEEEDEEGGITVTAVKGGEGEEEGEELVFNAKYVIACDGGTSPLRKMLNVHTYGKYTLVRAVSISFKSEALLERQLEKKMQGLNIVFTQHYVGVLITLNAKGDFALHTTFPADTSDEQIEQIVRAPSQCIVEALGTDIPHTITAVSGYNMHALMSTKFRVGRCFFVGDSAHQWLPAGGLGLNTGIADAFNVAWKIAATLKGYGGPHLLDSYAVERKPKSDSTRRYALSLGQGILGAGPNILSALLSNSLIRTFVSGAFKRNAMSLFNSGFQLVYGYQYLSSNIIVQEYTPQGELCRIPNTIDTFTPISFPGLRAPHVVLPDCASILDLFGKHFVLLAIGGHETDCHKLKEELKSRGVPLMVYAYPKLPELVAIYDRKYFLVRPDGIIAWRSDTQPNQQEASRICNIITGGVPPGRIPPLILKVEDKPTSPTATTVRNLVSAVGLTSFLHEYTSLSVPASVGAGMGVFWFLSLVSTTRSPKIFEQSTGRHRAAVVTQFGSADTSFAIDPKYVQKFGPNDVLVHVQAASINSIDTKIRQGYLGSLFERIARLSGRRSLFPLLLGRDCSGEIVAVGDKVTKFVPGDEVYGVVGGDRGTYSQLACLSEDYIALKPSSIDHREAASLPNVAIATVSALVHNAGLNSSNTRGKKVLVHGGTGGVGSFAVQLLKAWGAEVTVTCSEENIPLAHRLGADKAFNYKQGDFSQALSGFDVVLDTIGADYEKRSLKVLKMYDDAKYISLIVPYFSLLDKYGPLLSGIAYSWIYRMKIITNRLFGGRGFYYSLSIPDNQTRATLEMVSKMVEKGEIQPVVEAAYPLEEIALAHKHVEDGHTRGKVVVTMQ